MIICVDGGTLTRYTVKPTLDKRWSIFRKNPQKKGRSWKRVGLSPIWENPVDAAAGLVAFKTKGRYRLWAVVKGPDSPTFQMYSYTPELMELIPEETRVKSDD